MDLLQEFLQFVKAERLMDTGDRVLLALSGGVDSTALAHLFHSAGLPFGIAHCNFQLRGTESDDDEQFVRELAEHRRVPFFTTRFDTLNFATENDLSIQMAARALRYSWFEEIRQTHDYQAIATGHNRNDSIETALLNFIRGTGLTGLAGIPVRNGFLIRPLLFATREAISVYADLHRLTWREDSSNASDAYTRNAVRHHLLPKILEINPAFLNSADATLHRVRAADDNLHFLLAQWLGHSNEMPFHLEKQKIEALPARADALFEWLQPYGFFPEQIRQLLENWTQPGLEWVSTTGFRLVNDRTLLILQPENTEPEPAIRIEEDDLMVRLPDAGRLFFTPAEAGERWPDGRETVLVDRSQLNYPLLLRHWRPGDVFCPLGMAGKHQKVQDFFTNQKLSRPDKEQVWVLENSDHRIIWLVGWRPDERFKIEKSTTKLLKISWIKAG